MDYLDSRLKEHDPQKTIKFIEENRDKYMSLNDEAVILSNSTIGMIRLLILGDMSGARDIIESTGEILSKIDGVTSVHSRYYRMSSNYYKLMGQHAEYYREALRFLGCTDMADLPIEEKQDWAFSVGLAALLGNGVYNFGELISHEVLEELRNNARNAWLVDLLHAFNKGDLQKIAALKPTWMQNKDLAAAASLLEEKARLLALMELFFRRPPNQRTVSFEDIAKATGTSIDKVEFTVMRALSLNLMKGRIDEVKNTVSLVWLQPRVLDLDQIASMAERLKAWNTSVESTRNLVAVDAKAILA
ncbi:unnamed protein product [Schistocephalus solidus]|uniref:26S proteasome non-ATPase regulatory subunit 13 n=1 Tax=Schistocephalus solidus TaxID=70667 RepID=A0A183TC99_SCHSO|nr:unnamed protein product [Schistocephalus solidus]